MASNEGPMGREALALTVGFAALLLVAARCIPPPEPEPVDPEPTPTTTVEPDPEPVPTTDPDASACERACNRMAVLRCPGWEGTPEGTPCAEVCEEKERSGVGRFCPQDVAAITGRADGTCDERELATAFAACD